MYEDNWTAYNGHPWSGIQYQEAFTDEGTKARVVQKGQELVPPNRDLNKVYRQYRSLVAQSLEN